MESMETVVAFIIKKSETEILSKAEPDTQKMGSWDPRSRGTFQGITCINY